MNEPQSLPNEPIETRKPVEPEVRKPVDPNWSEAELENYKLHRRFDRIGRLVGDTRMKKLLDSHVMVIGLGGVGSWAAEMLVRSGVGTITLVDFDEVCITNFNRQLHALQGAVGQQKATVVAERLAKINPSAKIVPLTMFFNNDSRDEIFGLNGREIAAGRPIDFVVDAIDSITPKCMLLAHCHANGIPIVTSTGSSGKLDPTQIEIVDLAKTEIDPLARAVRRILREQYGFPAKGKFGIPSVFSAEPAMTPEDLKYDNGKGFKCVCPQGDNQFFQCDNRNLIMGSAGFVTASFGMAAASFVVRTLIGALSTTAPSAEA
jgi:tRNA A37 threonylcarbamoyladenosine dehydratase